MRVNIDDLGHTFDSTHWIFRNLTTAFIPGEITALTGPSGSGKSTLLSILAGWLTPTRGTVTAHGIGKTSWVFQNSHGVASRTTLDHVRWPLLARGLTDQQASAEASRLLDLFLLNAQQSAPFRALSGGEAQRLMLARAVAAQPQLLLIDEPTAQLDRSTAALVNSCIRALTQEHTIAVIATHDFATMHNCNQVLDLGAESLKQL